MLEIFAIAFFTKKIRKIAEEKNINPSKWIWRLVLTWFGVEIVAMILFFFATGANLEDGLLMIAIPALILAAISAFYTVKQLEKEPEVRSDNVQVQ